MEKNENYWDEVFEGDEEFWNNIDILRKESLDKLNELYDARHEVINIKYPIDLYITENLRIQNSQTYSPAIANKIIYDSNGLLCLCEADYGDVYSMLLSERAAVRKVHYEIKTSVSTRNTGSFRITHIRDWQEFNYYIVVLINSYDNFAQYYYLLPKEFICNNPTEIKLSAMNGTKRANKNNENIEKSITLKIEDALYLFEKNSLLSGTSYDDLMDYIVERIGHYVKNNLNPLVDVLVNPNVRKEKTKVLFDVNGVIIKGETNAKLLINLANYIEPLSLQKYIPERFLTTHPSIRKIKLNHSDFYLNPNISLSDTKYIINRANRNSNLNIQIIEE